MRSVWLCVCSDQRLHGAQVFDLVPAQVEVGQVGTFLCQSLQRTGQVVVAQLQLRKEREGQRSSPVETGSDPSAPAGLSLDPEPTGTTGVRYLA